MVADDTEVFAKQMPGGTSTTHNPRVCGVCTACMHRLDAAMVDAGALHTAELQPMCSSSPCIQLSGWHAGPARGAAARPKPAAATSGLSNGGTNSSSMLSQVVLQLLPVRHSASAAGTCDIGSAHAGVEGSYSGSAVKGTAAVSQQRRQVQLQQERKSSSRRVQTASSTKVRSLDDT